MPIVSIPLLELIQHRWNVLHAQHEVLLTGCFPHSCHALFCWFVLPYRDIATRMLKKHRDISATRPVISKVGTSFTGTTQPMTEKYNWNRRFFRWKVDANGNIPFSFRIMNREVKSFRSEPDRSG